MRELTWSVYTTFWSYLSIVGTHYFITYLFGSGRYSMWAQHFPNLPSKRKTKGLKLVGRVGIVSLFERLDSRSQPSSERLSKSE